MRITLCNQKGGAGKTSVTMLLSMALANAGRKVGIIDLDKQESASRWIEQIKQDNLITLKEDTDEACDIIFYDTPPKLGPELIEAIKQSDVAVIVTSPSPTDIWSTHETVEFINTHAPKVKKVLLFNKVEKGRKTSENLGAVAEMIGEKALKNSIPYYSAYQHSAVLGWVALKPKDIQPVINVALEISTY